MDADELLEHFRQNAEGNLVASCYEYQDIISGSVGPV